MTYFKTMKKTLCFIISIVLCIGLASSAFAGEPSSYYIAIPQEYSGGYPFSEGLAAVKAGYFEGVSWGFIDMEGNVVIPLQNRFMYAFPFSEGLAAVQHRANDLWGFIDKTGEEVVPFQYDGVMSFSEGLAAVLVDGYVGFIDKDGDFAIPPAYDYTGVFYNFVNDNIAFSEGLAAVRFDGKFGYIDLAGNEAIPFEYDNATSFKEGLAAVAHEGKWGFIDATGDVVIPFEFDAAQSFSEGLAAVTLGGKTQYIDKDANVIVSLDYDVAWVQPFSEDLATVAIHGEDLGEFHCGVIDMDGNVVIPFQYTAIGPFSGGIATATISVAVEGMADSSMNMCGIIDRAGYVIVPFEFDVLGYFDDGLAMIGDVVFGPVGYIALTAEGIAAINAIRIIVNGTAIAFDQPPIIENNRTLVPFRAIFEALGADVNWEESTQTVTAVRGDVTITLKIGSNILVRNGVEIELDVSTQIVNNRTLVPARAVAESLGAEVKWFEATRTVTIEE